VASVAIILSLALTTTKTLFRRKADCTPAAAVHAFKFQSFSRFHRLFQTLLPRHSFFKTTGITCT
jgi:hypothetical protein